MYINGQWIYFLFISALIGMHTGKIFKNAYPEITFRNSCLKSARGVASNDLKEKCTKSFHKANIKHPKDSF